MMATLTLHEEVILREKVNQYPVFFGKKLRGYREKDNVTNAWSAVVKEIEIERFLLFSSKNY